MGVVYAENDCVVAWSQGRTPLTKGDVWDDQAPLVLERPDLFSTEPTRVRGRRQARTPEDAPVEDATAKPGAKRAKPSRKPQE